MACFFALLVSVLVFVLPMWLYAGYYDSPPSANSAWVRLGDVCGKCCFQRCCRQQSRVIIIDGARDGMALGAEVGVVESGTTGEASAFLEAATGATVDGGALVAAEALGSAKTGSAPPTDIAPMAVPLFAADDEQTDVCACVNAAVEYELEELLEERGLAISGSAVIGLLHVPSTPAAVPAPSTVAEKAMPVARCCCGRDDGQASRATSAVLPFTLAAASPDLVRLQRAQAHVRDVRGVLRLLPLFAVLPIFWLIFDSQGSVWMVQRMAMGYCWGSLCATPEQLGVLNPIFILLLIPAFDRGLIPLLERCGTNADGSRNWAYPTPLRRMAVGMQVATLSFACSAAVQAAMDHAPGGPASVTMFAQVPQFLLITVAEILVSITGLEFAYAQAPPDMKSTVLAIYFVAISVGDLLTAALYSGLAASLSQLAIMLLFAGLMFVAGIAFTVLAAGYQPAVKEAGGGGALR